MSEIWERQPCDTDTSFKAFVCYRDQGSRPRRMPNGSSTTYAQVARWRVEHDWQERASQYDAHVDRIRLEEAAKVTRERAAAVAESFQNILDDGREIIARELERYAALARKNTDIPGVMKIGDLNKLAELVMKWEQILSGKPSEHVKSEIDMSLLTAEEKRELVFALAKASK